MHTYICIHRCIHTYTPHTHTQIHTHRYIYIYTYIYIYIYIFILWPSRPGKYRYKSPLACESLSEHGDAANADCGEERDY